MRTNLDEMASNISDSVVKLTQKDVPGSPGNVYSSLYIENHIML